MKCLILITGSYPYSAQAEQTFLRQEIRYLVQGFDRVIIVPQSCKGEKDDLPEGIVVDESYSLFTQSSRLHRYLATPKTLHTICKEFIQRPHLLYSATMQKRLLLHVASAIRVKTWLKDFFHRNEIPFSDCIFYTYWFDHFTTGLCFFKNTDHPLTVISRAHGYDLFEKRYTPAYIPCRTMSLQLIDALFPCMEKGTQYFKDRYKVLPPILQTSYLGTDEPGFLSKASTDGILRIVSNSAIIPVKRIDLLVKGLAAMAHQRPSQIFEWYHFGSGPLYSEIEELAGYLFPSNIKRFLPGFLAIEKIMSHYRNHPIDIFINVSSYEGQPVSIKEAISCGIPIVATDVGGNSEIVDSKNGILLSVDPSEHEIADAVLHILDHPEETRKMRKASRDLWSKLYSSEVTYPGFVSSLRSIKQAKDKNNG